MVSINERINLLVNSLNINKDVVISSLEASHPLKIKLQLLKDITEINFSSDYYKEIVQIIKELPDRVDWKEGTIGEILFKCIDLEGNDICKIDCGDSILPNNDFVECDYPIFEFDQTQNKLIRLNPEIKVSNLDRAILIIPDDKFFDTNKEILLSLLKEEQITKITIMSNGSQTGRLIFVDRNGLAVSGTNDEVVTLPINQRPTQPTQPTQPTDPVVPVVPVEPVVIGTGKFPWLDGKKTGKGKGASGGTSLIGLLFGFLVFLVIILAIIYVIRKLFDTPKPNVVPIGQTTMLTPGISGTVPRSSFTPTTTTF